MNSNEELIFLYTLTLKNKPLYSSAKEKLIQVYKNTSILYFFASDLYFFSYMLI